jgi:hypothetical protein
MKTFKICAYIDEKGGTPSEGHITTLEGYRTLLTWANMQFGTCRFLRDILPFQLNYRDFDAYIIDVGGYPRHARCAIMMSLGQIARSRCSRLFLFWTEKTWEAFCIANPDYNDFNNCINCCNPENFTKVEQYILDSH